MKKLKKFLLKLGLGNYRADSDAYLSFLRRKGVKIGTNVGIWQPKTVIIDSTRPSLLEFGNNIYIGGGSKILTHSGDWHVLRNLYHEMIASSGKVKIEDNVFIGFNVTILKGVTVGSNSIIAAGSIITKDVPPNSVVAGVPGRVICTIEEYFKKRKGQYIEEAKVFARSIKERFGRIPVPGDFREEFPLFMKAEEWRDDLPIKEQLGDSYDYYRKHHKPVYDSFEQFIEDAFKSQSTNS